MSADQLVAAWISGAAFAEITGSELYSRPERYSDPADADFPAVVEATAALRAATSRRAGRGRSYCIEASSAALEVVEDYCSTVGSAFAGQSDPDASRASRALLVAAERIRKARHAE